MKSKAIIVFDLGYGDAGKGTMVDYYARKHNVKYVIRFNGGGQAAHNVVLPDGTHHTFSMFSSGTFAGCKTILGSDVLVDPTVIVQESLALEKLGFKPFDGMMNIHGNCNVVTPYQKAANRILEMSRGAKKHGSCGMGIGETMADFNKGIRLRYLDLADESYSLPSIKTLQEINMEKALSLKGDWTKTEEYKYALQLLLLDPEKVYKLFSDFYQRVGYISYGDMQSITCGKTCIFEGAQGVLLDQDFGFHPYTTWSHTTPKGVHNALYNMGFYGDTYSVGVTRAYMVRHGPGPFPTEDASLAEVVREPHNKENKWQDNFRVGWFDVPALKYAIRACRNSGSPNPIKLALTCLDHIQQFDRIKVNMGYRDKNNQSYTLTPNNYGDIERQTIISNRFARSIPQYQEFTPDEFVQYLPSWLGCDLVSISRGPTHEDKEEIKSLF